MSPQDPLEQLLKGAFDRELRHLESTVSLDRVMARVRRHVLLRRIMLAVVAVTAMVVLMATLPDVVWLFKWLGEIQFANLAVPAVLPLLVFFLPWLLALLDGQV